ncbi:Deoxyribodipyrimidine photolyase [Roseibacterium elongatum DSM 19469]|uniref:Deoxyribodipyrimidine photolyase n=1 Tax=Roseicyclus elongatus DSM 19469 TaxID=1294273 RepID=W8RUY3_9RHOB|nr:deoxyribodipyrimidine photo-lyase [Roseibacterium elongatum]AHM05063.1 Deoxyribodipyrimidine photolyase [Roseibacterium elongatum DSM 19469]
MTDAPVLYWTRRDFRLSDNPALVAACDSGAPVIPVFICDEVVETHGAAPKWRLGLGAEAFGAALQGAGSRLIYRRGPALEVLRALIAETGATAVHWNRLYDPDSRQRDEGVKSGLKADGIDAHSHAGHILFEPWTVETGTGGFYKVYTPFWKAVRGRDPGPALSAPKIPAAKTWPESDTPSDWGLGKAMRRGADIVHPHLAIGEEAARGRLGAFMSNGIDAYVTARDDLATNGTSHLSENLTYGEISARACWWAGQRAMDEGKAGAETFLKEIVWRDFAYHLVYHTPRITSGNWREEWDAFPWTEDERRAEVKAWKQGRTGMQIVDAAMREMYVTGRMHNRARMLVASYLTKHLMCHWKIGLDWFEECLVDWDPASNAMGWQWSAGSGPDATPYFRVFNPETQAEKFDKHGRYRRRWLAEITSQPPDTATSYFEAIPESWGMTADDAYPSAPIVSAAEGRKRALAAYENRDF